MQKIPQIGKKENFARGNISWNLFLFLDILNELISKIFLQFSNKNFKKKVEFKKKIKEKQYKENNSRWEFQALKF